MLIGRTEPVTFRCPNAIVGAQSCRELLSHASHLTGWLRFTVHRTRDRVQVERVVQIPFSFLVVAYVQFERDVPLSDILAQILP